MKDRIENLSICLVTFFGIVVGWAIGQGVLYYARNTWTLVTIKDVVACWVSFPLLGGFFALVAILSYFKNNGN